MKTILHLCADIGSDSRPYQIDDEYRVITVGKDPGVENFIPPDFVYGIIANPVCTEFSTASGFHNKGDEKEGMKLVNACLELIDIYDPAWWVIENPANGTLKNHLGEPTATYQPWQYGSPWTKKTALWGKFNMPEPLYKKWDDVPKNPDLYVRPGRPKPSLAFLHKSAIQFMDEFQWCRDRILCDADLRSLCSQGFANSFKELNP